MPGVLRFRLILLCCCVGMAAVAVVYRLYTLQIVEGAAFAERAIQQHENEYTLPARRGSLLDRHGRTLAVSLKTQSFFAHPRAVEKPDAMATLLAGKIDLSRGEISKRLKSNKPFVWLDRFLDTDTAREIERLGRTENGQAVLPLGPGEPFDFEFETKRRYPRGRVASQVIGFADMDGVGKEGAEHRFDDVLQGDPTVYLELRDARSGSRKKVVREPQRQSSDVLLTLDLTLQHLLERELDLALRETGARAATAVILEPRTGQVLAMANRPTINRDSPARQPKGGRANRAIEYYFEPGSTFKIVPMALALEHGTVSLGERIYCNDGRPLRGAGGREIRDVGKNGMLTPRGIMAKSSNIGMVRITRELDKQTLYEGIRSFGFGQRTGIELRAESPGTLKPVERWSGYTHDSLSFGQEIGATALQIASAMATIANDGVRVEPRIGLGRRTADGTFERFAAAPVHRVVSATTARAVRGMLEEVVEKGSGSAARLPGYRVAGKSGTAQKVDPQTGKYSDDEFFASFVGFAPASDPAIVVLVALDSPRGPRRQGGEVAAPVFAGIVAEALQYLRVPKDADPPLAAGDAAMARIAAPAPPSIGPLTPGKVPDVRGRTLREAIATLSAHGYRVRVEGSGLVQRQHPAAGVELAPGGTCDLRAGPRSFIAEGSRRGDAG